LSRGEKHQDEPPHDEIRVELIAEIHKIVDPSISKPRGDDPKMETNHLVFQGDFERISRETMKIGSLVRIHATENLSHGFHKELGTLLDLVDQQLTSGRMCYAKVFLHSGRIIYISPSSLEFLE
jgi:hypothetical protein